MKTTSELIPVGRERVAGDLVLPDAARGLVIFAHGSGSGRRSPRNQAVARTLQEHGLATLLADLLTPDEEVRDRVTAQFRFDIDLLGRRLVTLVDWAGQQPALQMLPIGLFGASTGAAAALVAAAARAEHVGAVVSRGGRPDLAGEALPNVLAPTLMLVGSLDADVLELNRIARRHMHCRVTIEIVPGATHLFEEPGTLEQVAMRAGDWFIRHLGYAPSPSEQASGVRPSSTRSQS